MNKAIALIVLFLVTLLAALYAERAEAGPRIALGKTHHASTVTVGEIGYEASQWELALTQFGEGWTRRKYRHNPINAWSVSRLIRPQWCALGMCNYYRLGIAHVSGSYLVGDTNYRLGIGIENDVLALEYFHYSSAGIHRPNTGIDGVMLRLKL